MKLGKVLFFAVLAGVVALYFFGDPGNLLGRISAWGCEWIRPGKTCG